MIPNCPHQLPADLREPLIAFATTWAESPLRPRVRPDVVRAWDELLEEWIHTPDVPLFVRKDSARRGPAPTHSSGRKLIPCDNSPAVWAFTLALEGTCPTLAEVAALLANDGIPVEFARLRQFGEFYASGWKLAHVDGVGLRTRTPLDELPLQTLQVHTRLLLSPSNHFAVPKRWAGLGEIPEIIEVIREYDARARGDALRHVAPASAPLTVPRTTAPGATEPHLGAALPANTYRATRLLFRADVIEGLADDESFRVETPEGAFEMTRAQFLDTFANVAASSSYRNARLYSYRTTPQRALRFLVP